jgi:hypothetical protein
MSVVTVFGPIFEEQKIFATDGATQKLILCYKPLPAPSTVTVLCFSSPLSEMDTEQFVILTPIPSLDNTIVFKDVVNNKYLNVDHNNMRLKLTSSTAAFSIVSTKNTNTPWLYPNIMLTETYTLKLNDKDVMIDESMTSDKLTQFVFKPLPVNQYFNCNNINHTYSNFTNSIAPILNYYCGNNGKGAVGCDSFNYETIQTDTYSRINDCMWGRTNFCTNGSTCGQDEGCLGPCSKNYFVCQATGETKSHCQFDPNVFFEGQWWKNPVVIGIGIFLLLIIISTGILILFLFRRSEQNKNNMEEESELKVRYNPLGRESFYRNTYDFA